MGVMMMSATKSKNILILNGSPRKQGNTAVLLNWLEEALTRQNQPYQRYDLYHLQIKGCAHCNACRKNVTEPACAIKDDAEQILEEMVNTNIIVMASPIYCWSFSGCMSSLHDRMYSLGKHEMGAKSLLADKKMVGLFTSGGDAFDGMQYCVGALKDLCAWGGMNYLATVGAVKCSTPEELKLRKNLQQEIIELAMKLSR
jgi:multimeric flavodoxin WrbA